MINYPREYFQSLKLLYKNIIVYNILEFRKNNLYCALLSQSFNYHLVCVFDIIYEIQLPIVV